MCFLFATGCGKKNKDFDHNLKFPDSTSVNDSNAKNGLHQIFLHYNDSLLFYISFTEVKYVNDYLYKLLRC